MDQQGADPKDELLQETCQMIITTVAEAIDREPPGRVTVLNEGGVVGKQIVLDASEQAGRYNLCRLAVLDVDTSQFGEAARIEFEHDKDTKFGVQRVYSIQSVRKKAGKFFLLENFLATGPESVREADFRPIMSESYAQETVLKTLRDWTRYRQWQLQHPNK